MTRERREEVVLVALVVSVALHVGLMLLVRPKVMTHITPVERTVRRAPMHVIREALGPDPVSVADVADLAAKKDAPAVAAATAAPAAEAPSSESFSADVPPVDLPVVRADTPVAAAVFDATPVGLTGRGGSFAVPVARVETPAASAKAVSAPEFASLAPASASPRVDATPVPETPTAPDDVFLPTKMTEERAPKVEFVPAKEIYKKVDEAVVVQEKTAVRQLVETIDAADLAQAVNVAMTASAVGPWRYFKVMVSPRASLKVVPKDVVMLIDGSGSIGKDRLSSCRAAARRILRSATNSGDRFNLVVFRNAFSYAFTSWRDCDAESFAAGDKWLNRQTAHGRTDVFSTISSVLTLPRDPTRPLIALVVTDGDANAGVSDTAEILSRFTALNDGLVSVYMYGVKSSANRELIDVLTHGNRGEGFVFEGWRWNAGEEMEGLSDRFRDPVLSDLRVVFSAESQAESYPRLLRNIYRGGTLEFYGRVPATAKEVAFSLKGLNGNDAYEGYFKLPFASAPSDPAVVDAWNAELVLDRKLRAK